MYYSDQSVDYLFNNIIHTDVMDDLNQTILHKACESGNKATVQYLVEVVKCDVGECVDLFY